MAGNCPPEIGGVEKRLMSKCICMLKSSILSSTSFPLDKTFWEVATAALEQSRHKDNLVA